MLAAMLGRSIELPLHPTCLSGLLFEEGPKNRDTMHKLGDQFHTGVDVSNIMRWSSHFSSITCISDNKYSKVNYYFSAKKSSSRGAIFILTVEL
jgi:hypothetical protein